MDFAFKIYVNSGSFMFDSQAMHRYLKYFLDFYKNQTIVINYVIIRKRIKTQLFSSSF